MYQVILFDVDNTLLKTDAAVWATVKVIFKRLSIPVTEKETRKLMGLSAVEIFQKLGSPDPEQTVKDYGKEFLKHQDLVREFPEVEPLFAELKKRNIQIGIVTSKTHYGWQTQVAQYNFAKQGDKIIVSEDTKEHKPNPEPILAGMRKFPGVPKDQFLYVGDAQYDMQAAHAAGIDFGNAKWGAIPGADFQDAEYIFETPLSVLNAFKK
ncbi:Haloacid dehalogenase-like hydrolase [Pediococcus damnosus]|uniref:Haloacid dehalogenase-like hydrolase n=1 Tax=Pediococcus damnosus TaxID=51663 RepID=A0A0R2HQ54_9LACO|nr:HAD family hydrolase [Pediococcus damnosus]AMV60249.1 Haloacid dehalogenase-like hydrolase [Pediococcus damnosus]AMV62775.1 Haloacid dehalogenase-like hydrolase [Pediococcus damnosus]AMV64499.1 Haloacid dehalogenase-like hydrolase [Pediococcus damnosus]AMV67340.1 Haloacid dehalogenase-like hydrolase [Pediococcus damnosus]AMV69642.1 Haloacid dehalogenase-like hydrolase [Pediococcus damnosus]